MREKKELSDRKLDINQRLMDAADLTTDPTLEALLDDARSIVRSLPGLLIVEQSSGWICANGGADGSNTYAVTFGNGRIETSGRQVNSLAVTNSTYAAESMRRGDQFTKRFGGVTGDDLDFFNVTLKEVFITSVSNSASAEGDMLEAVSMSYRSIDFSYKAQDAKGGLTGEVKFGWDVKTTKIT